MMHRKFAIRACFVLIAALAVLNLPARGGEKWKPTRTVTIYVWSSAGGLADLTCRALAESFREQFGVPFNAVNMLGGGGGTAANHVYNQAHDGYSLLSGSDAMHALGIRGAFNHPNDVWETMFLVNAKGVISVRADSPIQTVEDLVKAAKESTLKAGASQAGNVWGVKLAQFNKATDTTMNQLPYEGATQTIVGLLSGEIDVAVCGLPEQEDYIRSGKIRPLAILELEGTDLEGYGPIKPLGDFYPDFGKMKMAMQWCGLSLPADCPQEVIDAYTEAFNVAFNSKPVRDLAANRSINLINITGQEAKDLVAENDSVFAWMIYDSGLAIKSPAEFGIPRP